MLEQTVPLQIKFAPGDAGTISGYASVFGPPADRHGDVIAPGAFTASLASGDKPLMLWSHDLSEPIGVWTSIKEDAKGLLVTGRLTLESRRASEAYALLKDGALNGLSIGFRTVAADELPDGGRLLTEIELAEISLVTLPSASRARVTSVKSGEITPRVIEGILRDAGISKRMAAGIVASGFKGAMDHERDARSVAAKSILNTINAATSRLTKG
ncbi:MAG: HK97 family phage prohead protease [Rhodospirillales bacterium]